MAKKTANQMKDHKQTKLEFAEELNIQPRLKPSKSGSVSQNTARPISPRKGK